MHTLPAQGRPQVAESLHLANDCPIVTMAFAAGGAAAYVIQAATGRFLEPDDFGAFFSVTFLLIVMLVLSSALTLVVARHSATMSPRRDRVALSTMLRALQLCSLGGGASGFVLIRVASPAIARFLKLGGRPSVVLLLSSFPLASVTPVFWEAMQGLQHFTFLALSRVSLAVLRLESRWYSRSPGSEAATPLPPIHPASSSSLGLEYPAISVLGQAGSPCRARPYGNTQ